MRASFLGAGFIQPLRGRDGHGRPGRQGRTPSGRATLTQDHCQTDSGCRAAGLPACQSLDIYRSSETSQKNQGWTINKNKWQYKPVEARTRHPKPLLDLYKK